MPPQYQDTWEKYPSMAEMAGRRVANPGPNLGGTQCPASQFTFAVSEDGGENWRNPRPDEQEALNQAIIATGRCCQKTPDNCFVRK